MTRAAAIAKVLAWLPTCVLLHHVPRAVSAGRLSFKASVKQKLLLRPLACFAETSFLKDQANPASLG